MDERMTSPAGVGSEGMVDNRHEEVTKSPSYTSSPSMSTTIFRSTAGAKQQNNGKPDGKNDDDEESLTLAEKLRRHYQKSPKGNKAKHLSYIMCHCQGITGMYMLMCYVIPYCLQDYSEMTRYYCKIFYCYLFAMAEANWFCSVLYSNDLPDIRDRPTLDKDDWFQRPPENLINAESIESKIDKYGFEWKYCKECNRYKPPRSHHCNACGKCILRRDHHCYFIGRCVGHYNQRYFVSLAFLCVFGSIVLFPPFLVYFLSLPDATWSGDYVLPYTLLLYFYYGTVSWQYTVVLFQLYVQCVLCILGFLYFTLQISLITSGKTLVEVAKQFDMKVTSDWRENMRMVFGDYWFINFIFPAQIIFKQRHDGIHYEGVKFFGKDEEKK